MYRGGICVSALPVSSGVSCSVLANGGNVVRAGARSSGFTAGVIPPRLGALPCFFCSQCFALQELEQNFESSRLPAKGVPHIKQFFILFLFWTSLDVCLHPRKCSPRLHPDG